jgi:hypothetical protein
MPPPCAPPRGDYLGVLYTYSSGNRLALFTLTLGVLEGYSRGTRGVLGGVLEGYLEGYSGGLDLQLRRQVRVRARLERDPPRCRRQSTPTRVPYESTPTRVPVREHPYESTPTRVPLRVPPEYCCGPSGLEQERDPPALAARVPL